MTLTTGQLLLLVTLIAPAVGAVAAATVSARSDRAGRLLAAGAAGVAFLASVGLVFDRADGGTGAIRPWHAVDYAWAPGLDLRFHIGVDGVSYPLVVLTTLLTLLCAIYTCWHVPVPDGEPAAGRPEDGCWPRCCSSSRSASSGPSWRWTSCCSSCSSRSSCCRCTR